MAKLVNLTKDKQLLSQVRVAVPFKGGAKGLIGTKSLTNDEGLWIKHCNWVHTFFMSMAIDVIYLGRDMKVKKIHSNLRPWRLPAPVFTASSVVEVASGVASQIELELGDQLYVGD